MSKTTIAIAGAGDFAKYIVEESLKQNLRVVVLSRSNKEWFTKKSPDVSLHMTDYSADSVRQILDATGATALFSLINAFEAETYVPPHRAFYEACKRSKTCKRFSPAYYAGNIDEFPGLPRFYGNANDVFIKELPLQGGDVEWTITLLGWFMDYIAIFAAENEYSDKSYLKALNSMWSIDMNNWKATLPGTGDEPAAFTSARDVAKAVARLATTPEPWQRHTYVLGEQITWNILADKLETFHSRKLTERKYRSLTEIQEGLRTNQGTEDFQIWLQMQEWSATGAQGLPLAEVERQRVKYFKDVHFRTVDEFLQESKTGKWL
ncbi:hypothetical protein NQ176_g8963 [Zarea fungicola]|uniref:Uncharacterized protein n=1 Tax=Zarea fungicola TaxID=93591 RepID=A0ACC1MPD0_9HYPO|nr:hypothetical protein NQ176_g8963 [Lecanicillium fungicola]